MAIKIVSAVFMLLAGIGVFLVAIKMMSSSLEMLSGDKLKLLFAKTSKSKLLGVGIGTVATAAIQSSGATSVMVIGFVNAGIMSLTQAATIIFGANIGTTITGQIVALGTFGNEISTTLIFSAFAGIGAFMMMFAKKSKVQHVAALITSFGLLFIGLDVMSAAMDGFTQLPEVLNFLASIKHPLLLVLIGAVLTAIIQSSSVMTGIAITMVYTGLINIDQGIYMTLGSNIGSCVVAIIASIGSTTNAKRTALIHLLFNTFGVIIFLIIDVIMRKATVEDITFGLLLQRAFPGYAQTQLAMLHTFFNIGTVIIILPFTDLLVKLVTKIIPDKKGKVDPNEPHLYYIEEHFLSTPPIAVAQVKNEICNMAEIAMKNFNISMDTVCDLDFKNKEKFQRNENELNFLNKEIVKFIVKLTKTEITNHDHVYLSMAFHSVTDLERIGDYAENIMEYAEILKNSQQVFSDDAIKEIHDVQALINNMYDKVMKAYVNNDSEMLEEAYILEDQCDEMTGQMEVNHIIRLDEGTCTPEVGAQYLSLASNTERIGDHLINVAQTIKNKHGKHSKK